MRQNTICLLCGIAIALLSGCYKHSYEVGSGGNTALDPTYDAWQSHWFFGIIGESEIDLKRHCPSGNATIKDRVSFLNGLVGALIGIVWYPSTIRIYCDEGAPQQGGTLKKTADEVDKAVEEPAGVIEDEVCLQLSPAQLLKIARDPATLEFVREHAPERLTEYRAALEFRAQHDRVLAARASR